MTITPHTRSLITHSIEHHAEWTGERDGVRMRVARQLSLLTDAEIHWQAEIGQRKSSGQSYTVFDACSEIELFSRRTK